jgi:phosphoglycerate dehydrogenase-like enzyme
MAADRLVAVSYPADDEFTQINTRVLDGSARVAFLHGRPDDEVREVLGRADVLVGWHLGEELPAGALQDSARLRFIQLLSAGADSVDYAALPSRLLLASNATPKWPGASSVCGSPCSPWMVRCAWSWGSAASAKPPRT